MTSQGVFPKRSNINFVRKIPRQSNENIRLKKFVGSPNSSCILLLNCCKIVLNLRLASIETCKSLFLKSPYSISGPGINFLIQIRK